MVGIVTKYDRVKGWGFILPDDQTLPDFFVCAKFIDTKRYLRFLIPGQRVEFTPADLDTKPTAHDVHVLPTTIAIQHNESNGGTK